jgi:glycine cleavage system H protein
MTAHEIPDDLRYTAEHEWVRLGADGVARIGITAFAQDALGDVVFVTLPDEGTQVSPGSTCGEVESTKSVSDIYAPVTGTVAGRNADLEATPELVNSAPYGDGWMFEVRVDDPAEVEGLLDAAAYRALLG